MFTPLFQKGNFRLASGQHSNWKIECDALTNDDWDGLAAMLVECLPYSFYRVEGVPRGGIPFARALEPYRDPKARRILVVDDVWTTGDSMRSYLHSTVGAGRFGTTMLAVAFARNPTPVFVTALFQMPGLRP